jgi:hypothetical protein
MQNPDNLAVYVLEANWARNNADLAEIVFQWRKLDLW